jgi:quaternary ammonium compound-resistance protein SugE
MSCIYLVVAGLLEVGWAVGLKYTHGFSKPIPTVLTVAAMVGSMWLLAVAVKTLPIGTAYAVWVGIGAAGAALLGIVLFREPVSVGRAVFLAMLVVSVIGLRLTSKAPSGSVSPAAGTAFRGARPMPRHPTR